jgi:hypothetical protein
VPKIVSILDMGASDRLRGNLWMLRPWIVAGDHSAVAIAQGNYSVGVLDR